MTCPCATLPMRAPRESRAWDAMRRDISAQGGEMRFSSARYAMQSRSAASIATALCPCLSRCASCPLSPCILSSHSSSLPCRDHRYAAHAPQLHSHTATALLLQSSSAQWYDSITVVARSLCGWRNIVAQTWSRCEPAAAKCEASVRSARVSARVCVCVFVSPNPSFEPSPCCLPTVNQRDRWCTALCGRSTSHIAVGG